MLKFKIFSKEFLDGLSLMVLREIGREIGVKSATSKQKSELIDLIIAIQIVINNALDLLGIIPREEM